MADFAPNYTARYRLKYRVAGKAHHTLFRVATALVARSTGFTTEVGQFLDTLAPSLPSDWQILGVDVAEQDSDVFLPAPQLPVFTVGKNPDPATSGQAARYASWTGRTALGNHCRIGIFGLNFLPEQGVANDFRLMASEGPVPSASVDYLNQWTNLRGIDLAACSWYPYVNVRLHAYWQGKLRG